MIDFRNKNKTIDNLNDPKSEFIYPWLTIEKADNVDKIIYYEIDIFKCQNSTKNKDICKSNEEINSKLDSLYFQLKFVDNMFNVGNYSNPVSKYINNKNTALKRDTLVNFWLNFFSVSLLTNDGLIFENLSKLDTYAFDFHSEAFNPSNDPLVHQTQFYILNNSQNYERSYSRLQNVAADIGGIYKFFFMIGSVLNLFFENFSEFIINNNLLELLNKKTKIQRKRVFLIFLM